MASAEEIIFYPMLLCLPWGLFRTFVVWGLSPEDVFHLQLVCRKTKRMVEGELGDRLPVWRELYICRSIPSWDPFKWGHETIIESTNPSPLDESQIKHFLCGSFNLGRSDAYKIITRNCRPDDSDAKTSSLCELYKKHDLRLIEGYIYIPKIIKMGRVQLYETIMEHHTNAEWKKILWYLLHGLHITPPTPHCLFDPLTDETHPTIIKFCAEPVVLHYLASKTGSPSLKGMAKIHYKHGTVSELAHFIGGVLNNLPLGRRGESPITDPQLVNILVSRDIVFPLFSFVSHQEGEPRFRHTFRIGNTLFRSLLRGGVLSQIRNFLRAAHTVRLRLSVSSVEHLCCCSVDVIDAVVDYFTEDREPGHPCNVGVLWKSLVDQCSSDPRIPDLVYKLPVCHVEIRNYIDKKQDKTERKALVGAFAASYNNQPPIASFFTSTNV